MPQARYRIVGKWHHWGDPEEAQMHYRIYRNIKGIFGFPELEPVRIGFIDDDYVNQYPSFLNVDDALDALQGKDPDWGRHGVEIYTETDKDLEWD